MFRKEIINKIQKMIPHNLYIELKKLNTMIAGGAITSLYTGKKINDFDLYFKNEDDAIKAEKLLKENGYSLMSKTNNALTFENHNILEGMNPLMFQIIIGKNLFFDNPKDLIASFDFTINMAAFDLKAGELIIGDKFEEDNLKRKLIYNNKSKYPIVSLQRAIKYINRGYSLSPVEQVNIALHINSLLINNLMDLKIQLQGIDTAVFSPIIKDLIDNNNEEYDYDTFKEKLDKKDDNNEY